ncbi:retrovirus-related pol polyprotein from transposon TNT 1-94 [Tanacetum coccineum]
MSNTNTNLQTQTSNALHNAIMEAGGKDRPPMLAPGNYNLPYKFKWIDKIVPITEGSSETTIEWFMETYKNVSQDIRNQLDAKSEAIQIILTGIDNDIYSTVDACPNACEMWKEIERLKQGESINVQDLETNLYWEFGKFTSRDGESLESYYSRFYKMMNELVRNQCDVTNHQVNVQFLLQLQPEWQRFVTLVKQSQELKTVSYHKLYDILKQHQNEVNEIRAERLACTANPLALVAQQQPVYHPQNHPNHYTQNSSTRSQQAATRNRGKAIINSPPSTYDQEPDMVTKDDALSKEGIDKLMALISLSFKKIYKPTNNNLKTSSNTNTVNQDNTLRINKGTGYDNQREVGECRECQKPKRAKDAAYHKEKMLLCKQEKAGIQLSAEQADWRDDTDDEPGDQELEAHYMYMAQIQEVTLNTANFGPIFDAEPLQKVQNDDGNYNVLPMTENIIKNRNKLLESSNKNLVDKLKGEIEDFKTKNKSLESSNNHFKEANNELSKTSQLMFKDLKKFQAKLDRYHDVNYASNVKINCAKAKEDLMSYKIEAQKSLNEHTRKINDLNQTILEIKKELFAHQETISIMAQEKEAQNKFFRTREDKEIKKVTALENKVKVLDDIVYKTGQTVQTMNMLNRNCKTSFVKPEFLKKAQRANPHMYDIGCYDDNLSLMLALESDETIHLAQESRSILRVIPTTSVSRPQPKSNQLENRLVEIILFIVDFGCSKHMTGNLKLLSNFVEQFLGTVKFRNDQISPILGYGDLVQGNVTIKRVYYVEGLNHNLFSIGQFCDADLEVSFQKSTCYIRDLKGNDLLTGSHGSDLYSITLQDIFTPNLICLMAKAKSSQAWLWHRHLSHLNFDTINLLLKYDIMTGLPKLKFVKDHLCSSCELGKAKRKSFKTKTTPSSNRRLQILHMDLCGPIRVESFNGKKYVLVIVDDYSRYNWTHFLRSKDETPEVLIDFLKLVQRGLHAQIRTIQTDKGTKFLNKKLHAYFA